MGTRTEPGSSADKFEVDGRYCEYRWLGPKPTDAPTLVFLHEGLGCISTWSDFPERLATLTGCGALIYSRFGYGSSDPAELPRPISYMHDEALAVLPAVLTRFGIEKPILFGHSDGGSIALIYAGSKGHGGPSPSGLVLEAPHVFVEPISVQAIQTARTAYETADLRRRLERHHGDNVDNAFRGWNDVWLDPDFRSWNIEGFLPPIQTPVLVLQGQQDAYGTLAQLRAIEEGSGGKTRTVVLENCGHAPHRDQTEETLRVSAGFVRELVADV